MSLDKSMQMTPVVWTSGYLKGLRCVFGALEHIARSNGSCLEGLQPFRDFTHRCNGLRLELKVTDVKVLRSKRFQVLILLGLL